MAFQFIPALQSAALGTGIAYVTQPWFASQAAAITPANYQTTIDAWDYAPILQISTQDAFYAYTTGFLSPHNTKRILSYNGVAWNLTDDEARGVGRTVAGLDFTDRDTANSLRLARNAKLRSQCWEQIRLAHMARPSIPMAIDLRTRDRITDGEFDQLIKEANGDVARWQAVLPGLYTTPDLNILVPATNRGLITEAQFDSSLRHLGFNKPAHRDVINKLREQLPTISDLILFGVRDVWDRQAVDDRKLFDDTPQQLREWAAKQGMFGLSGVKYTKDNEEREAYWPEVYWAAHWQPVSHTQARDMFVRLRENRMERYRRFWPELKPYDQIKFEKALKIADYPVGDRDYLAALSFNPMRLVDIRAAITTKVRLNTDQSFAANVPQDLQQRLQIVDRTWAIEQYRDRGYHPDDAAVAADIAFAKASDIIGRKARQFEEQQISKALAATVNAYKVGTLDKDETIRVLVANGVSQSRATSALGIADIEQKTSIVKAGISKVRSDYFEGVLTVDEARGALRQMDLKADAINNYMDLWQAQRDRRRRVATTQKLLQWFEQGLITRDDILSRLANLGWSQGDRLILLREANLSLSQTQAKMLSAAERSRRSQVKELESAARQSVAQRRQAIAALRQAYPRQRLLSQLAKGVVSPQYVQQRLTAQGYPSDFIQNEIRTIMVPNASTRTTETNGAPTQEA